MVGGWRMGIGEVDRSEMLVLSSRGIGTGLI